MGKAICDLSGGATECPSSKSEKMCFTPPTPGIVGFEVCSWIKSGAFLFAARKASLGFPQIGGLLCCQLGVSR